MLAAVRSAARSADPTDAALLGRFVADRDAAAFAVLVARHGATVFGVCRRVLGNAADADDAFQATFVVLVRRAAAVRDRDRLAGWLAGVAYRTAVEARSLRAKRRRREGGDLPDVPAADAVADVETIAAVEAELHRLPAKLRDAVLLCEIDGRPRSEAATLLGVPEGTLSSRLAAGRKALAGRLARRGLAPVVGAAVVPAALADAAVRAAVSGPTGSVSTLVNGVLRHMLLSKLKLGLLAVVPAAAIGVALAGGTSSATPPLVAAGMLPVAGAADDDAGQKKVADAQAVVVKTVPAAGAEDVDPKLDKLSVTFSKPMGTKGWSFATDPRFGADIDATDKPTFADGDKTCVLPIKLKPGTTYAVWLNTERFTNFRDAGGDPSLPYLLVFRTKK